LEAAGYNPLMAQDMMERLSQEWWDKYLIYRREQGAAQRYLERKARG